MSEKEYLAHLSRLNNLLSQNGHTPGATPLKVDSKTLILARRATESKLPVFSFLGHLNEGAKKDVENLMQIGLLPPYEDHGSPEPIEAINPDDNEVLQEFSFDDFEGLLEEEHDEDEAFTHIEESIEQNFEDEPHESINSFYDRPIKIEELGIIGGVSEIEAWDSIGISPVENYGFEESDNGFEDSDFEDEEEPPDLYEDEETDLVENSLFSDESFADLYEDEEESFDLYEDEEEEDDDSFEFSEVDIHSLYEQVGNTEITEDDGFETFEDEDFESESEIEIEKESEVGFETETEIEFEAEAPQLSLPVKTETKKPQVAQSQFSGPLASEDRLMQNLETGVSKTLRFLRRKK